MCTDLVNRSKAAFSYHNLNIQYSTLNMQPKEQKMCYFAAFLQLYWIILERKVVNFFVLCFLLLNCTNTHKKHIWCSVGNTGKTKAKAL